MRHLPPTTFCLNQSILSTHTMKKIILFMLSLMAASMAMAQTNGSPLRIGVSGVAHGHLWNLINAMNRGDFVIVGVAEENDEFRTHNNLVGRLPKEKFYASLTEMLDKEKPEAVVDYGSILHHTATVEACAQRGIHVMVEKPLATTYKQALRMEELARKYGIKIMTNYETTWYAANHHLKSLAARGQFGRITRIDVYDGHQGPKEIGCDRMFLSWLTDPVQNGGGAVIDFGCYGVNLATWLLGGEKQGYVRLWLTRLCLPAEQQQNAGLRGRQAGQGIQCPKAVASIR